MLTLVVNRTLVMRWPLSAVIVKKFSPFWPSANVCTSAGPLSWLTVNVTEPAAFASMLRINELKVKPGRSVVSCVRLPSAPSIRACPLDGAVRSSFDANRLRSGSGS